MAHFRVQKRQNYFKLYEPRTSCPLAGAPLLLLLFYRMTRVTPEEVGMAHVTLKKNVLLEVEPSLELVLKAMVSVAYVSTIQGEP